MIYRLVMTLGLLAALASGAQAGGYGSYGYGHTYGYGYATYPSYGYSAYAPYSYEYWPGGYWQGAYYKPGYYRTYYGGYDYAVNYITVPLFSVGAAVQPPAGNIPSQPMQPSSLAQPAVPAPAPKAAVRSPEVDKLLIDTLLQLRKDVDELKRRPARVEPVAAPRAAVPARTLQAVVQRSCAACHDAAVARQKGKGWVAIADGKLRVWSDHDWRLVFKRVIDRGTMPPPGNDEGIVPLTEAEVKLFIDALEEPSAERAPAPKAEPAKKD